MNAISDWTLANLVPYGAPLLLVISYIGSLGIPFPVTLVVIAAGAFARAGLLEPWVVVLACLAGAALADHSEYFLGRLAKGWLRRRFGGAALWQQAQSTMNRQGGLAVLLTRFWLTPLAPAVNVIAGSRYPLARFLFFDLLGELLWVLLYGGLGYLFAAQWELVSQTMSGISGLSVGLAVLALGAVYLLRRKRAVNS